MELNWGHMAEIPCTYMYTMYMYLYICHSRMSVYPVVAFLQLHVIQCVCINVLHSNGIHTLYVCTA